MNDSQNNESFERDSLNRYSSLNKTTGHFRKSKLKKRKDKLQGVIANSKVKFAQDQQDKQLMTLTDIHKDLSIFDKNMTPVIT